MRKRIVTSAVLLCILAAVLASLNTLVLNLIVGIISIMAVFELLKATNLFRFRGLAVLSVLQALILVFMRTRYVGGILIPAMLVVVFGYFTLLIMRYGVMGVEHCAMAFMFSTLVPLFFSCAVHIRDDYGLERGGFYLLVALGSAWLTDTGAYFVGVFFGRHKLAARVSPQKTVEGALGGLIFCTLSLALIGAVYVRMLNVQSVGEVSSIQYPALVLLTPVFSAIGMLGDLSASAIKRQFGVKDYGDIMPGHGGVLDRFDSVLFTLPAVYSAVGHIELMTILS